MFKLDQQASNVSKTKRLMAYIIDFYLGSLILLFPMVYIWMLKMHDLDSISKLNIWTFADNFNKSTTISVGVIGIILACLYYWLIPYFCDGQSLGKKIMKIKVVALNNQKATLLQLFIREIIGIIILEGYLYSVSGMIRNIISIAFKINLTGIGSYIAIFFTIGSIVLLFMAKSQRMLHDYLAKTKVINKE